VARQRLPELFSRTSKDILHHDSPEFCARIAKTLGTHQVNELSVRRKRGPLMTSLSTGEASSRMPDACRLHPNAIKNLARCGQGDLPSERGLKLVAYGMLPPPSENYSLARNEKRQASGLRLHETFISELWPPLEGASRTVHAM